MLILPTVKSRSVNHSKFHAYPITFIPLESTFTLLLMQVIQHFVALFISISIPTTCSTKFYTWKYFVKHLFIILILEILVLIVIMPSNNYHITITYFHARLTLKKNISPFALLKLQEVMHYLCVGGYKEKLIGINKQQQHLIRSSVKMAYTRVFLKCLTPSVFPLSSVLQSAYR